MVISFSLVQFSNLKSQLADLMMLLPSLLVSLFRARAD